MHGFLRSAVVLIAVALAGQSQPPPAQNAAKPAAEDIGFAAVAEWTLAVPDLTDAQVDDLLATLDRLLPPEKADADWKSASSIHFWRFQNRFERARSTDAQRARVG